MHKLAIVSALLFVVVFEAIAADETLSIGQARLRIGMNKMAAWRLLKGYDIRCLGEAQTQQPPVCTDWMVTTGDRNAREFRALGSVYFSAEGRLRLIMKYYDAEEWGKQPAKLASLLYEVLLQYGQSGKTFVTSLGEVRQPGSISKAVFFTAGRRTIKVSYLDGGRNSDGAEIPALVTLHEELR